CAHFLWQLLDVAQVLMRDDHVADGVSMGGNRLFLQTTDREDASAQGDLARHRHFAAYGDAGERADDRRRDRDARRRPVLRRPAPWDVDMQVARLVEVAIDAEDTRASACVAERRAGRLLHDIPERAGETQLAATADDADFDLEHFAAHARVREPGCN